MISQGSCGVEPVDVAQGGELDAIESLLGTFRVGELQLVEAVEVLGHRIDVAVPREPTEATMSLSARRSE